MKKIKIFILLLLSAMILTACETDSSNNMSDGTAIRNKVTVLADTFEDGKYAETIKNVVTDHYESNIDFKVNKECTIAYEKKEEDNAPITYWQYDPVKIYLSQQDDSYWCQIMYQLSHEITHYIINEYRSKENGGDISWIEETICEAMSFYYLDHITNIYNDTDFYKMDPEYGHKFKEYGEGQIEKKIAEAEGTDYSLARATLSQLSELEKTSMTKREYRAPEMQELYKRIKPEYINGLMHYRDFADTNNLLLNTAAYRKAFPNNEAVEYLCSICDDILGRS